MLKRDPQEIADFFGCYVVQDADDSWLLFEDKPVKINSAKCWDGEFSGRIYQELIDYTKLQDEAVIYKPQPIDAIKVFKSIQERKNSAPHQSEVRTHKEYEIIVKVGPHAVWELRAEVNRAIECGWSPLGGISVSHSHEGNPCIYQAMVRGLK